MFENHTVVLRLSLVVLFLFGCSNSSNIERAEALKKQAQQLAIQGERAIVEASSRYLACAAMLKTAAELDKSGLEASYREKALQAILSQSYVINAPYCDAGIAPSLYTAVCVAGIQRAYKGNSLGIVESDLKSVAKEHCVLPDTDKSVIRNMGDYCDTEKIKFIREMTLAKGAQLIRPIDALRSLPDSGGTLEAYIADYCL